MDKYSTAMEWNCAVEIEKAKAWQGNDARRLAKAWNSSDEMRYDISRLAKEQR